MNHPVPSAQVQAVALGTADQLRDRIRRKSKLKGRQPDEQALAEVRDCLGPRPPEGHRRDLLIEHLHRLNDRFGALREPHLVALSREMNVPMAEIYEVATFYHHFEVVPADAAVPGLTVGWPASSRARKGCWRSCRPSWGPRCG
jgi:formate dehydrogenase